MDDSPYGPYLLIMVFIAFSAYFSASEIAFASANKMRLKKSAESGSKRAELAYFIFEHNSYSSSLRSLGNILFKKVFHSTFLKIRISSLN